MAGTMIVLEQILSAETVEQLRAEAERQHLPLTDLVREAIEEYLADDVEDTPDDKIEADFRAGWHEAMTGQTIPADEALAAIRKEMRENGL